ncbi:hypothetical protein [Saccharopolyspora mangrovi]|uniref:PH domain-containing protein n=1 Tax=Saccharopolyspora mangrovi TaxID=3082379 RepID=A0ABU6A7E6_9PSEU|nr:hypothetical protein [Saccharopolyspora sp. S2-29]MEB3367382.1 hypothetical protein [Saccharopolyspora sp. S2-29]
MDQEVKERWISALESGQYEPGFGALRKVVDGRETHCCLGVLADLLDPEGWGNRGSYGQIFHRCDNSMWIDDALAESIELDRSDQEYLASLNDGVGEPPGRTPGYDRVIPYIKEHL